MKPFAFSLEKVLQLRKFYEDEAKMELGRATGVLADLETRLAALGNERERAAAAQFSKENSLAEMRQYSFYLLRLDNDKERLLKETALAERKVEEAREAFLETSRERKALDKLKEKRQKEYSKETLAAEAKDLDDISSSVMR